MLDNAESGSSVFSDQKGKDSMANAKVITDGETRAKHLVGTTSGDIDPTETAEWLESLEYILESRGPEDQSHGLDS